jgi:hypothetical protein
MGSSECADFARMQNCGCIARISGHSTLGLEIGD